MRRLINASIASVLAGAAFVAASGSAFAGIITGW
jgi:hypothetical protein